MYDVQTFLEARGGNDRSGLEALIRQYLALQSELGKVPVQEISRSDIPARAHTVFVQMAATYAINEADIDLICDEADDFCRHLGCSSPTEEKEPA